MIKKYVLSLFILRNNMEKKELTFCRLWKVASLGDKLPEGAIPIETSRFKSVLKTLSDKGYRLAGKTGEENHYRCDSVRVSLFINHTQKVIRAEAFGESGLSKAIDDFGLPAYKQP